MKNTTKYLLVLVGTVALIALALSAVSPALAQTGTGGSGTPQAGESVALQSGDTLGKIVDNYTLSGDNLRNFFLLNSNLVLASGQTVTYPAGVDVNTSGSSQGQGTSNSGSTSGQAVTDAQLLEFVTLNRDLSFADNQSVVLPAGVAVTGNNNQATATATQAAGGSSSGSASASATPAATATQASGTSQANTYITQADDTLGKVMGFMGFQANVPVTGAETATATETQSSGGTTGGASGSVTATATQAAGGSTGSTSGSATATATPAAGSTSGSTSGSATATATPAAGGSTGGNTTGNTGTTGSVPQTGNSAAQVDFGPGGNASLNLNLLPENVPAGEGVYVVQSGDNLSRIARRFNTTVEWLMTHNHGIPNMNLIFTGQRLVVPQSEVKGAFNYQWLEQQAQKNTSESVGSGNNGSNNNAGNNGSGSTNP